MPHSSLSPLERAGATSLTTSVNQLSSGTVEIGSRARHSTLSPIEPHNQSLSLPSPWEVNYRPGRASFRLRQLRDRCGLRHSGDQLPVSIKLCSVPLSPSRTYPEEEGKRQPPRESIQVSSPWRWPLSYNIASRASQRVALARYIGDVLQPQPESRGGPIVSLAGCCRQHRERQARPYNEHVARAGSHAIGPFQPVWSAGRGRNRVTRSRVGRRRESRGRQ